MCAWQKLSDLFKTLMPYIAQLPGSEKIGKFLPGTHIPIVDNRIIMKEQPDYVVILEVYGRETVLQDAGFLHAYHLIETIPTDLYGSQGMLVFRRMTAP